MNNRKSSFGCGGRKTSLQSARGFSKKIDIISTTRVFALVLVLMGIIATSASLLIGQEASSSEVSDYETYVAEAVPEATTSTIATTTTTTTEATTTTLSVTTTTWRVKVEATTTTTTLACGGDWQQPCDDGCDEESVLGADGICHTVTCVQSVPSGNEGCGEFALKFCRSGTYTRTNVDKEYISS